MESKTSHRRLSRMERVRRVWALRVKGWRLHAIAKELGVSIPQVAQDIALAFDEYRKEMAAEAAESARLDLARHDKIIEYFFPLAEEGNHKAAQVIQRSLDARGKI